MKPNRPKTNWIVDAVLFLAFVVSFYLDLTGLPLHQWLGVFVGVLASYHLLVHWAWVKAVTKRLFKCGCGKARWNYLTDSGIMLGLALIILTGLVISTWLNLTLGNYLAWRDLHVWASIGTVLLVVLKVGLHWRWIVSVARKHILPQPVFGPRPALVPVPVESTQRHLDRRAFLVLMGGVSLAGLLAVRNAGKSVLAAAPTAEPEVESVLPEAKAAAQAAVATTVPTTTLPTAIATASTLATSESQSATAEPVPTATLVPTAKPTAVVQDCVVRCSRGCSYPGSCRKYTDDNNNRLCDLGECL